MLDVLRDSYMLHTAKSAYQRFLYYEIIFLTLIVDVFYYNYLWMCAVGAHQKSMHALDNEACTDNASHAFAQSNYFNFCLTRNRLICEFSRFRRNLRMAENCGNSILILYLYCSISWRRILTMQKAHTLHIAVAALPVVVMVHAPQSATAAKAGIDSHTGIRNCRHKCNPICQPCAWHECIYTNIPVNCIFIRSRIISSR